MKKILPHTIFALWLNRSLHENISTDDLLDTVPANKYNAANVLDIYSQLRKIYRSHHNRMTMEILLTRPGHFPGIPVDFHYLALESQMVIILSAHHVPSYDESSPLEADCVFIYKRPVDDAEQLHNYEWDICTYSSPPRILEPYNVHETLLELSRLQQNFIVQWQTQAQLLHHNSDTVLEKIQKRFADTIECIVPGDCPTAFYTALRRITHTHSIIEVLQENSSFLTPDCQQALKELEQYSYHALTAVINTAMKN